MRKMTKEEQSQLRLDLTQIHDLISDSIDREDWDMVTEAHRRLVEIDHKVYIVGSDCYIR
jgi:hypothetical protein